MFSVLITKDREPRSFRFQLRPAESSTPLAISRAQASPSAARREAERLFGLLAWEDPSETEKDYILEIAHVELAR
jgi:hypothetical protein